MNGSEEIGSWDLALLEDLTEDNLINNLKERYKWEQVYVMQAPSRVRSARIHPLSLSIPDLCGHLLDFPEPTQATVPQQQRCY